MDFRIWWDFYHINSLIYPNNSEFKDLICEGIEHLSCTACIKDARSYIKRHYWHSNSSMLYKFHNNINIRLNKKTLKWDEMIKLYKNKSPKELLDIRWKFIMMVFKVTKSPNELLKFLGKFLKLFCYDFDYDPILLLGTQNQYYIYSIYLKLGGLVPFEDMILTNK